jgi:hypothetical protein
VPSGARTAATIVVIAGPLGVGGAVGVGVGVGEDDGLEDPQRRAMSDSAITPLNRANAVTVMISMLLRARPSMAESAPDYLSCRRKCRG